MGRGQGDEEDRTGALHPDSRPRRGFDRSPRLLPDRRGAEIGPTIDAPVGAGEQIAPLPDGQGVDDPVRYSVTEIEPVLPAVHRAIDAPLGAGEQIPPRVASETADQQPDRQLALSFEPTRPPRPSNGRFPRRCR